MPNQFYTVADAQGDLAKAHISIEEITCHAEGGALCPDCHGQAKILVQTAWGFKLLRETLGTAIIIDSGYRCPMHQKRLFDAAVAELGPHQDRVAPPYASPHNYAAALDLKRPDKFSTSTDFANWIDKTLAGDVRIGTYSWGCHIDRCHYLNPNPDSVHFRKGAHW